MMGELRHRPADRLLKVEMTLHRTSIFTLVAVGVFALGGTAEIACAQGSGEAQVKTRTAASTQKTRTRTRIRVTPVYQNPGPNAVRQCTSWLAEEYRLSGTVIVPHVSCWWERR
jgi:hypothetical protein